MIIRSSKALKSNKSISFNEISKKTAIVKEEVKKEEFIPKKKNNKKPNPTPVVIEKAPEVVEEEIKIEEDKIDLSEWLKEEDIID